MTILDDILAVKREELAAFRPVAAPVARGPRRSLVEALRRPPVAPVRMLAEIKRASPSAGPIRPGADPAEIARAYTVAGAAAISVLTDRRFFDGDLAFLAAARAVSPLPILRKDFVIDPRQIDEAADAGADAVLLIAAALPPRELAALAAHADARELDALVEVHDLRELDAALAAGARLVGVNHRDLRTFAIDMSLTAQIAARVPASIVLVAESGIRTAADVERLGDAGAHAVLVGETLMRAADPAEALLALRAAP